MLAWDSPGACGDMLGKAHMAGQVGAAFRVAGNTALSISLLEFVRATNVLIMMRVGLWDGGSTAAA